MAELKIKIGEEYKIKIETGDQFSTSIFNELYEKAAININDIINESDKKRNQDRKESYNTDFSISDDYNNIIAFTGERGTGKSSSMVSFAEALINKNEAAVGKYFNEYKNINRLDFLSIEMIDPSLFGEKDTLLEIIISKMFLKFQKDLDKKNNSDLNYDKKRELITLFQKVFENLKTLHGDKKQIYEYEAIETLSKLANGTNLKENLFKLVENYLEYFDSKKGYLVIAIDDFDLNIKGAYKMLEDIRQYLIQRNIIILLACKIEQLQDSITQTVVESYKELISYLQKENLSDSPEEKTIKYLNKLLPIAHRLETPKFIFSVDELDISKKSFSLINSSGKEILSSRNIQDGLLEYISDRIKIFIPKPKTSSLQLFPSTLRELINLVGYINTNSELIDLKNYLLFRIEQDLSKKNISFFDELEKVEDTFVTQYILNWTISNVNVFDDLVEDDKVYFKKVLEVKNNFNSSFGDIYLILKLIESNTTIIEKEKNKFLIYLKLYYSIRTKLLIEKDKNLIYNFITPELVNSRFRIFPSQRIKGKSRNEFAIYNFSFLLDRLKENNISVEDYFWICNFITHLGEVSPYYRNHDEIFYKVTINQTGSQFKEATFSWLSFLITSLNPNEIVERFIPHNLKNNKNDLKNKLLDWNNTLDKSYFEIFNLNLIDEIFNFWSEYNFGYKESLGSNYAETMSVYFSENALLYVFTLLKTKYPYLTIDENLIINHPILTYWRENRSSIDNLLNEIFESQKDSNRVEQNKKHVLNFNQKAILKEYINNLPLRKNKSKTTANLIRKLISYQFSKDLIDTVQGVKLLYNKFDKNNVTVSLQLIDILKKYLSDNG